GTNARNRQSPKGTAELGFKRIRPRQRFSRPFGTFTTGTPNPTLKGWAIVSHPSRRERKPSCQVRFQFSAFQLSMKREHQIRHECFLHLYGSKEPPTPVDHTKKAARREGFDYSRLEIREALFFLRGQGLCELAPDYGTGERRHRITSAGMIY